MKLIFTLVGLFAFSILNAAEFPVDSLPGIRIVPVPSNVFGKPVPDTSGRVGIRCHIVSLPDEPLWVIDNLIADSSQVKKLNPADIESVSIFKDASSSSIYPCRKPVGVIFITTKRYYTQKFIIRDKVSGDIVPFATVTLKAESDSVSAIANENALAVINNLKRQSPYNVIVSSVGYKDLSTEVMGDVQEIWLEREIKTCSEVVVVGYPTIGCRNISLCTQTKKSDCSLNISKQESPFPHSGVLANVQQQARLFPNPVQRNQNFNLEFFSEREERVQVIVSTATGNLVLLRSQQTLKGVNRFSMNAESKWSAGMYIVQVRNDEGSTIKTSQLLIQ